MNGQNFQDESYNLGMIIVYGDYVKGDVANDYEEYTQVNKWGWELNPKAPDGKSKEAYKKILEEAYKKVLEEPMQALSRGRGKIPTYYIGNLLTSGSEELQAIKREILSDANISISPKFI